MLNNGITSEVVDLIHVLCRLCQKRNEIMFKKLKINQSEFDFFMSANEFTNLSINQIANRMELPQGNVSRIVDKLVKRGFLERIILSDKRSTTVSFTIRGKNKYTQAHENRCLGNEMIKNILENNGYETFKDSLKQIIDNYKI